MKKPILLVMAAGMGSRYGGLKQIDPVGSHGEILLDFSLYDAMMAGFEKVVFIIKRENEEAFRALIDPHAGKHLQVEYVFQELEDLPDGYSVPEGREKPWGTCHAVYSARKVVDAPFVVINADDYYGAGAFAKIYDYLEGLSEESSNSYAMVGYSLPKTLTENGSVSRGVCEVSADGYLKSITERTSVMWKEDEVVYQEEDGTEGYLPKDTTVSMNFWGFTPAIFDEIEKGFRTFLEERVQENPLKSEFYLPAIIESLIDEGKATVKVLASDEQWYGVTYKNDKSAVMDALQSMKDKGIYPDELFL